MIKSMKNIDQYTGALLKGIVIFFVLIVNQVLLDEVFLIKING